MVRDADGRIVYANAAAMRILGRRRRREPRARSCALDDWLVVRRARPRARRATNCPSIRALRTGRIVDEHGARLLQPARAPADLAVGHLGAAVRAGQRQARTRCCRCSPTSPRSSATARCSTACRTLAHIGGWEWDAGRDTLYLTDEAQRILGQQPRAGDAWTSCWPACANPTAGACATRSTHAVEHGGGFDLELQGIARRRPRVLGPRHRRSRGRRPARARASPARCRTSPSASRPRKPCACRRAPIR